MALCVDSALIVAVLCFTMWMSELILVIDGFLQRCASLSA
jgi:hypothetical protein